jgi:hypothetical protein
MKQRKSLLEVVFSVRSVLMLSNESQLPLEERLETTARTAGGWCEMAASLGFSEWSELVGE